MHLPINNCNVKSFVVNDQFFIMPSHAQMMGIAGRIIKKSFLARPCPINNRALPGMNDQRVLTGPAFARMSGQGWAVETVDNCH